MHEWAKVIAEAIRKINVAGTSLGLDCYQHWGTRQRKPANHSVGELWPEALETGLLKADANCCLELLKMSNVEPGEGTLEWALDRQLPILDRILFAREQGTSQPATVVMLHHKASLCIQRANRAHSICRHMGWLPLNVCKTIYTVVSTECTEKGNPSYIYGIFSAPKKCTWLFGTNLEPYLPYGGVASVL